MSRNMIATLRGITVENVVGVAEALIEQNISRIDVPPASPAGLGSSLYAPGRPAADVSRAAPRIAAALRQASVPHG